MFTWLWLEGVVLKRHNSSDSNLSDTIGWLDMPADATARLGNLGE
jgi:hypothetical protein